LGCTDSLIGEWGTTPSNTNVHAGEKSRAILVVTESAEEINTKRGGEHMETFFRHKGLKKKKRGHLGAGRVKGKSPRKDSATFHTNTKKKKEKKRKHDHKQTGQSIPYHRYRKGKGGWRFPSQRNEKRNHFQKS